MSGDPSGIADFERRLHGLLEESVQRVGGRARSRLNQARHAALAEAARQDWRARLRRALRIAPRDPLAIRPLWLSATGAVAAAVLVAFVLWPRAPRVYPAVEASPAAVEDLDLLADREGMDLMQSGDGQFYEWAMAQADQSGPAAEPGTRGGDKSTGDPDSGANTKQNSG
jgi:hypothetical protein